ncbi:Gfo/Idh/MocA family oxidoreductase [Verrucomicrobiales bacterium]|nr:Gfo/Idh/MocA family oxidoreductase [Verrucomicrobiales bacterium]
MSQTSRRQFLRTSGGLAFAATTSLAQSPPPTRIRVAQIGTKHSHASGKLSTLLDLRELYAVVGVCEEDQEQRERVSSRHPYKDCQWMNRDAILNHPDIQLIAVETEIDQLVPTAIQCLQAGKHIHLDKPAGQTVAPCRAMHAEATKRKLTIQMGYMLRYNPAFEFLFRAVEAGWLGQITEVHGHMGKQASPSLRKELSQYPGGGLFELACHLVDALITVLGKPDAVVPISLKTRNDKFLDNQLATFRYPNALATIGSNHNDPFGGPRRQFTVIGTEGSIEIRPLEPPSLTLSLKKARDSYKRGRQQIVLHKSEGRYHGEFRDFARIIRGEKALAWDAKHDIAVQETLLKACGLPPE